MDNSVHIILHGVPPKKIPVALTCHTKGGSIKISRNIQDITVKRQLLKTILIKAPLHPLTLISPRVSISKVSNTYFPQYLRATAHGKKQTFISSSSFNGRYISNNRNIVDMNPPSTHIVQNVKFTLVQLIATAIIEESMRCVYNNTL